MTQGLAGYLGTGPNAPSQLGSYHQADNGLVATTSPNAPYEGVQNTLYEDPFGVSSNIGTTYNPTGVYAPAVNAAEGQAQNYNQMAQQTAGHQAPTINNPYAGQTNRTLSGVNAGQNALIQGLQGTAANGTDSLAYKQYQNSLAQNLRSQTAVANSAGGGGIGAAGARRNAQEQNAMTQAGSVAGGQLVAQTAQQAAAAQLGQALAGQGSLASQQYANAQQAALAQAQLYQEQHGINNAGQLGYNSLASNEQGNQLNALQGASNAVLGSQGLGQAEQQVNNAQNAVYLGAATGAASGTLGAVAPGIAAYANSPAAPVAGPTEAQLENPYYGGA